MERLRSHVWVLSVSAHWSPLCSAFCSLAPKICLMRPREMKNPPAMGQGANGQPVLTEAIILVPPSFGRSRFVRIRGTDGPLPRASIPGGYKRVSPGEILDAHLRLRVRRWSVHVRLLQRC